VLESGEQTRVGQDIKQVYTCMALEAKKKKKRLSLALVSM
jgi:hypothetical protein